MKKHIMNRVKRWGKKAKKTFRTNEMRGTNQISQCPRREKKKKALQAARNGRLFTKKEGEGEQRKVAGEADRGLDGCYPNWEINLGR